MREHKYRGKRVDNGKWAYGWLCVWQGIPLIFDSPFNLFNNPVEVIPETVGQSTGIKDKNGTEDHFGDIVQTYYVVDGGFEKGPLSVVVWNERDGAVEVENRRGEWPIRFYSQHEVIGNQTDNPELLREEL